MSEKPITAIPNYQIALVKFNSGAGALLCNGCRIILATGFDHLDQVHYCPSCRPDIMHNAVTVF